MEDKLKNLQEENQKLKIKLQNIEEKKLKKWKSRWKIAKVTSTVFLGKNLKESIKLFLTELSEEKAVSIDTLSNLLSNIFLRLTRIGIIAIAAAILPSLFLILQAILLKNQNKKIEQQIYLQEAERRSSLIFMMSDIMETIDDELKDTFNTNHNTRKLTKQTIGRIIALNLMLKPYYYLDKGELIEKPLSPERGELLIALVKSDLDIDTYHEIFKETRFEYADLENAKLDSAQLDFVDLEYANLKGAKLRGANLFFSTLRNANLNLALLSNANMEKASLRKASLIGTQLDGSVLENAILDSAYFYNVNIKRATFTNTRMIGTEFHKVIGFHKNQFGKIQYPEKVKKYPWED